MRIIFVGLLAYLVAASQGEAKIIGIENDTEQSVASMDVTVKAEPGKEKKPKKSYAIGLESAPGQMKDKKKDKERPKKSVEIDLADDECLAEVVFTLGNGAIIQPPAMDLCGLDAIVVEDPIAPTQ